MTIYYTFAYPEEKALEILQQAPLELQHKFDYVLFYVPQEGYISYIFDGIHRPECVPIESFDSVFIGIDKVCLDNLYGLIGFLQSLQRQIVTVWYTPTRNYDFALYGLLWRFL